VKRGKMLSKQWYENWYSGKEKIFAWNIGRPHPGLIEILDGPVLKPGRVLMPAFAKGGYEGAPFEFKLK